MSTGDQREARNERRLPDYESFWLFYVSEHRDATCRRLHLVGTGLVFVCLALAAALSPWSPPRWPATPSPGPAT